MMLLVETSEGVKVGGITYKGWNHPLVDDMWIEDKEALIFSVSKQIQYSVKDPFYALMAYPSFGDLRVCTNGENVIGYFSIGTSGYLMPREFISHSDE